MDNRKILKFGTGNILVTPVVTEGEAVGKIFFQTGKGTGEIGGAKNAADFCEEDNDTIFTFSNTKSIDVVIERLEKLKRMMSGDLSGCICHAGDKAGD